MQGSKRIAARLEGHNDPRALSGLSQFLAAGTGGVVSQSASSSLPLNSSDEYSDSLFTHWIL